MTTNALQLTLAEFKSATKVFTPKRSKLGPALFAFEGGFLSIESGEITAVMRATGKWHGRATIPAQALRAIATVPPNQNPLTLRYADGRLHVATVVISCEWEPLGANMMRRLADPGLLDLLAMGRTLSRAEVHGSPLGKRVQQAQQDAEKCIQKAAKALADLNVTEHELRALVEARITDRQNEA